MLNVIAQPMVLQQMALHLQHLTLRSQGEPYSGVDHWSHLCMLSNLQDLAMHDRGWDLGANILQDISRLSKLARLTLHGSDWERDTQFSLPPEVAVLSRLTHADLIGCAHDSLKVIVQLKHCAALPLLLPGGKT